MTDAVEGADREVLTKADLAAMIPVPDASGDRPGDPDLQARLTAILVNDINRVQQDVVDAVTHQVRHEQGRFDRNNPCTCDSHRSHHGHNHLHVERD
jgi:hypothetical protein